MTNTTDKNDDKRLQQILVFQQNNKAESKIKGIYKYGEEKIALQVLSLPDHLPPVIDEARQYFPERIEADLVLDYLTHPDLSHELALMCREKGIPVIASGKKTEMPGRQTPPTCCALSRQAALGPYGVLFGAPEFQVDLDQGVITGLKVLRGAPCGATWEAAKKMTGLPLNEALVRIGLDTQYFCTADPSAWDPISGKSPVHIAAELHKAALAAALKKKST